jgi:hypothetical protein
VRVPRVCGLHVAVCGCGVWLACGVCVRMPPDTDADYEMKRMLLDDMFNVVDMEGRLSGKEVQVGGFDLIWQGGPIRVDRPATCSTYLGAWSALVVCHACARPRVRVSAWLVCVCGCVWVCVGVGVCPPQSLLALTRCATVSTLCLGGAVCCCWRRLRKQPQVPVEGAARRS